MNQCYTYKIIFGDSWDKILLMNFRIIEFFIKRYLDK